MYENNKKSFKSKANKRNSSPLKNKKNLEIIEDYDEDDDEIININDYNVNFTDDDTNLFSINPSSNHHPNNANLIIPNNNNINKANNKDNKDNNLNKANLPENSSSNRFHGNESDLEIIYNSNYSVDPIVMQDKFELNALEEKNKVIQVIDNIQDNIIIKDDSPIKIKPIIKRSRNDHLSSELEVLPKNSSPVFNVKDKGNIIYESPKNLNRSFKNPNVITLNNNHAEDLYPVVNVKAFDKKCKYCNSSKQEIFRIRKDFLNIKDDNRRIKNIIEDKNKEINFYKKELDEKAKLTERDSEYIKKQDMEITRLDFIITRMEEEIKIKEEFFERERIKMCMDYNDKINEIKNSFSNKAFNVNYYNNYPVENKNERSILNSGSNNKIKNLTINNKYFIKQNEDLEKEKENYSNMDNNVKNVVYKDNNKYNNSNVKTMNTNINNNYNRDGQTYEQNQSSIVNNSNNMNSTNKYNKVNNNNQSNQNNNQIILDYASKEPFDFKNAMINNINNFFESAKDGESQRDNNENNN